MDDDTDAYIACGGPGKADGYERMWKLLFEHDCKTVVILSNLENVPKDTYWPSLNNSKWYGSISVDYVSEEYIKHIGKNCITRLFYIEEIEKTGVKVVKQFEYNDWPKNGVPTNAESLVAFLDAVKLASLERSGPLVVHGRVDQTGTFMALHMLSKEVEDIENGNDKTEIDIYSCIKKLREQRVKVVENLEQYKFLHEALSCYVVKRLESKRVQQRNIQRENNES